MGNLGPPTIQVYDPRDSGPLVALEGSHRLAAAHALDLPVYLVRRQLSDRVAHDFGDLQSPCAAERIVDYLRQSEERERRPVYSLREAARGRCGRLVSG